MNHRSSKQLYGMIGDQPVHQYTLANSSGMLVKILDYGGTVTHIITPDRYGQPGDVVLGFDTLDGYLQQQNPYFGCLIGRYANRIAHAMFTLDGQEYRLAANNNGHSLHGGLKGFDKKLWTVRSFTGTSLELFYRSPDGEEGFPGNLDVTVIYSLDDENALKIDYTAVTDQATPVNLTSHCYFNLSGGADANILGHELMIRASCYSAVDEDLIPTGEAALTRMYGGDDGDLPLIISAAMDFAEPKKVGQDITGTKGGYDNNWILDNDMGNLEPAATLYHAPSGRFMEVFTTEPGMQLYTSNSFDGSLIGKGGTSYERYGALCLEAQHFPDSPNKPAFPDTILRPGDTYRQITVYKFSVRD